MNQPLVVPMKALQNIRTESVDVTSGAAGSNKAAFRPAQGAAWLAIGGFGWHTAGAARACTWSWVDPVHTADIVPAAAAWATDTYWPLYLTSGLVQMHLHPLVLTYERYLFFEEIALAAAEHVKGRLVIAEWWY